jgi:hypothetical protein
MQVVVYTYLCLRPVLNLYHPPVRCFGKESAWLRWRPSRSLATCASRGHDECLRFHVRNGANINAKQYKNGTSALHRVMIYQDLHDSYIYSNMCALIDVGADVNCVDDRRESPLHLVARLNAFRGVAISLAQLLIENGADVNARREGGYTPLHYAASGCDVALVKLLLAHGADFEAGLDGNTGSLITPLKLMQDYCDPYNLETEALLIEHERVTFGRKTYAAYRELALVFVGTRLPTYVVMWILDYLPEFTGKSEVCKIRLLERVWCSHRSAVCRRK